MFSIADANVAFAKNVGRMEAFDKAGKPEADAMRILLIKRAECRIKSAIRESQKDVWGLRDK